MKTFKVIDPKGIHAGGKHLAKGERVKLPDNAATKAFLHFKQVEPVKEKEAPDADADAAAAAEAEAEAKAKAEAEAKAAEQPADPSAKPKK
jgi:hypothetical protein